jgi:hypothetical protein
MFFDFSLKTFESWLTQGLLYKTFTAVINYV